MPSLLGYGVSFKALPARVVKAISLDVDELFDRLMACYPEKSPFKIDVSLKAALKSNKLFDVEEAASGGLGSSYVGIVANMPLYSGSELDRQRDLEYNRRKDTAKAVSSFIGVLRHVIKRCANWRFIEA